MSVAKDKPTPPFEDALVKTRKTRAMRAGDKGGDLPFLYTRIAQDVIARLQVVTKDFKAVLLIGDPRLTGLIANHFAATDAKVSMIDDQQDGVLPFAENAFDLIVNALTLQHINNIPLALMSGLNSLHPDGLYLACFFGGDTLARLRHSFYEAEDIVTGQVSPRISPMIKLQQAAGLLQSSGFALPVADRDQINVNYKQLNTLFSDLRAMGETNALTARSRTPATRSLFKAVEAVYRRDHQNDEGKLAVCFELIWLSGWKPHESQQKPLRPGSAKMKLSDALGVKEKPL